MANCSVHLNQSRNRFNLSTPDKAVRVMVCDLGLVVLTVHSVQISVSEIFLHLEKPFLIICPLQFLLKFTSKFMWSPE